MLFVKSPHSIKINSSEVAINTLELCVLSKSKNFLSQPIIVRILNRFYKGELIQSDISEKDKSSSNSNIDDDEEKMLLNAEIMKYKFNKVSINRILRRANTVPKYQNLVINLKLIVFAVLYFILIFKPISSLPELAFWLMSLSLNIEVFSKILSIDSRFLKLVIWNYIDVGLVVMLDFCFILKIFGFRSYYNDFFSLIGIVLFPRILSVFNNYKFFNLIVTSFNKMIWNLVGLILFFFTLISGFYFSFIALSYDQTSGDILFNMVKIFFGFTPSVWNNWEKFNTLGKIMQMFYLFLIQFIVGTILAICLSGIFNKARENIEQEFNYTKSKNLVLYFKMAVLNQRQDVLNYFLQIFKIPIILLILGHEILVSKLGVKDKSNVDLRNFVFFTNEEQPETDEIRMYKRGQKLVKPHQSLSTLGGGHLRTASTDSFFIDQLLNRKYGGRKTYGNTGEAVTRILSKRARQTQSSSLQLQQPFSIPQQPPQQIPQQQPFSIPQQQPPPPPPARRQSIYQQAFSFTPQSLLATSPNQNEEILSRLSILENVLLKNRASMSKSLGIYDIQENVDEGPLNREREEDSFSISSEVDTSVGNLDDTLPIKIDTLIETQLDQYDSDDTF
ncbi:hypothetical protein KGF56_000954 [Candida oxycetoniae]|uniref:Calcium channel YVC1-like C-terminal transmembrane domain-containing protein n=1 Tax=Candida oxycetoniae TaxID=497107 RepID=A0AAI9WZE4_9ASCO|nr:uncharacterized protein KGF56_000954 [Candida oxycetoniae]KAI3406113.2 hypothetical protein KGF56_000954 [Candida oxycetoniae]